MVNLAVTIPASPALEQRLAILKSSLEGVQWKEKHSSYITLRCLGNIDNSILLEEIDYELSRLTWPAFSVAVKSVAFQNYNENYKIGVSIVASSELIRLKQKIDFALQRAGASTPRRRFAPFLELGILPSGKERELMSWLELNGLFSASISKVDQINLIEVYDSKNYGLISVLESYGPAI
ncbi:hypothetical protein GT348_03155 [Aristophania vespae]|uniref:2'-5' RNA ligase n=1 Tax=Aristophania vespae TaxID=2697033 RepID=A0A6P1NEV5_9PROT|nr:hypothetical protein [Aristophania vespae]QHI95397.1 hypothetical protein GT348_03155 [Aristophania vespae]UMM64678.1 RNA 2',3'-cyclic phosphodiesterase [Aristophania vespae]